MVLYVREQLERIEFCLVMDEEPTESLWVKIKGKTGVADIITHSCSRRHEKLE